MGSDVAPPPDACTRNPSARLISTLLYLPLSTRLRNRPAVTGALYPSSSSVIFLLPSSPLAAFGGFAICSSTSTVARPSSVGMDSAYCFGTSYAMPLTMPCSTAPTMFSRASCLMGICCRFASPSSPLSLPAFSTIATNSSSPLARASSCVAAPAFAARMAFRPPLSASLAALMSCLSLSLLALLAGMRSSSEMRSSAACTFLMSLFSTGSAYLSRAAGFLTFPNCEVLSGAASAGGGGVAVADAIVMDAAASRDAATCLDDKTNDV
mmetsp:Transcript_13471/g.35729  ORF Transcript_13471/g.35729 Transcript_13471/m.35729 type:complete len:267 (+) Transcript_13471:1103-1903(+)